MEPLRRSLLCPGGVVRREVVETLKLEDPCGASGGVGTRCAGCEGTSGRRVAVAERDGVLIAFRGVSTLYLLPKDMLSCV